MACTARWFLLVWLGLLLSGCTSAAPKDALYLTHLSPQSGPDRELGRQAQQAVMLAVDEINHDNNGILGRQVQVREIDTHGDADVAQGEVVRLLSLQRSAAVIAGLNPVIADKIVRSAHPYATTVIVPGELPEPVSGDGAIALGVDPRRRGENFARYATQDLKAKHAIVLTSKQNPLGQAVANGFVDEWRRAAGAAPEEWAIANLSEEADLLKRLAAAKPDVVLVGGSVSDLTKLRSQAAAGQFAVPLLYGGEDGGAAPLQAATAGPDVYLATVYTADALTDKGKAFAKKYEERFHEPPDLAALSAYDAVRLVAETMQHDNSTVALDLRASLSGLEKFESLLGTITWKDHQARRRLFVVRLHEKESNVVKTSNGDE